VAAAHGELRRLLLAHASAALGSEKLPSDKRPLTVRFVSIFDISERAANAIYSVGSGLVVISALIGVLGAIGVFWGGGVRDRFARMRLSDNTTATAKANAEASRANERAASLEKDAANARLELERLKEKQRPRTINESTRKDLVARLSAGAKGPVIVQSDWTDTEAKSFAEQIKSTLKEAGFDIVPVTLQVLTVLRPGTLCL
jgi:hypothetical protein